MGKNMTENRKPEEQPRKYLRRGALALLVALGIGSMAGMAAFNHSAKPNRDMQWYVTKGDVEVAAPVMANFSPDAPAEKEAPLAVTATAVVTNTPKAADIDPEAGGAAIQAADIAPEETPDVQAEEMPEAQAEETAPEETPDAEAVLPTQEPTEAPEEEPVTGPVTLTITAAGDCTFCGQENSKSNRRFKQYTQDYGYDYFFENVRSVFEKDDLTIVNLEGPMTDSEKPRGHGYVFKADPACVSILTGSSVELCNVANNHAMDYGMKGLEDTARILSENGVGYCGYSQAYTATIKGVRVCALGFTKWDHTVEDITAAVSAARQDCDLLIVNMHWGWERQHDNDATQTAMGHAAIDAGADLVIGTHPHVYQGIEKYKGKYIVYSLGNFCFAGNANPADKRCLIFQQSFGFTPGMGMAQAGFVDMGINIIPANISSAKNENDFKPTIMPAEEGAALLKAVASRSTHFSAKDVRWMKDNYMVVYGLIQSEDGAAVASAIEGGAVEAEAEEAAPEEETDGSAA